VTRKRRSKHRRHGPLARFARLLLLGPLVVLGFFYTLCTVLLGAYNFVPPPVTGVQIQRQFEAFFETEPYRHQYRPVARAEISTQLARAVVSAEDGRFYQHRGVDWKAIQEAVEDNRRGRRRGGSTITQQFVKNLFLTTHSNFVRKALELPLAYIAELVLPKERILTLYLNVIEWDRGVYGAEAASRHYFGIPARDLSRYQAASLAAVIPNPRQRSPQSMGTYTNTILRRMSQMGW
jgi:monofunctional glycosyltransferase